MATTKTIPRAEAVQLLRRTGFPAERVSQIEAELPDPIDLERDAATLMRHGLTRDHLMDLMGGSP